MIIQATTNPFACWLVIAQMIQRAHEFASRALLDLLIHKHDLFGRLRSLKHFFLLDQGDFFVQFMDTAEVSIDILEERQSFASPLIGHAMENPTRRNFDAMSQRSHFRAWNRCSSRSEEYTSELQSLMRISYAVFCLKKKTTQT